MAKEGDKSSIQGKVREWWPSEEIQNPRAAGMSQFIGPHLFASNHNSAASPLFGIVSSISSHHTASQALFQKSSQRPRNPYFQSSHDLFDALGPWNAYDPQSFHDLLQDPKPYPDPAKPGQLRLRKRASNQEKKAHFLRAPRKDNVNKENGARRDLHVHNERQRRRDMSCLFMALESLVPCAKTAKIDRCTVLTEVIEYIHSLRQKLDDLTRKKCRIVAAREACRTRHADQDAGERESGVTVYLSGSDAHVTLNSPIWKRGLWSRILMVFQEYDLDVVHSAFSSNNNTCLYYFHAKVPRSCELEGSHLRKTLLDLMRAELPISNNPA